jgi:hypothetical protein
VDPTCTDCQRWTDLFRIPPSLFEEHCVDLGIGNTLTWIEPHISAIPNPQHDASLMINNTSEIANLFYLEWGSYPAPKCRSVAGSIAGQDAGLAPRTADP